MMTKDNDRTRLDLVRGSLVGGAAGDALGYPVEFMQYGEIVRRFGPKGITSYVLDKGVARISDDTQMTLFTANGMLLGLTRGFMKGVGNAPEFYVEYAYQDWFDTQMKSYERVMSDDKASDTGRHSWLGNLPELYARRAPGNTCLSAISEIKMKKTPRNDSKGCGGVMRVAPYGLYCACHSVLCSIKEIDVAGGEIARLTHKHPLGWMPAIVLTHILYRLVSNVPLAGLDKTAARQAFAAIVNEALLLLPKLKVLNEVSELTWEREETLGEVFHNAVERLRELVERALALAANELSDVENICRLGEGWVGEEALAIAIYATARHIDSFEDALVAAVNHSGDSDSTGAVTGNIIGAIVGYDAIPAKFKQRLELHDVILAIADDLHQGCIISEYDRMETPEKKQWYERYCKMRPSGIN